MQALTLHEAIDEYLFCCRAEAKSPHTIRWYQQKLEYFARFVGEDSGVSSIERADVRALVDHLQNSVTAGQNNPCRADEDRPLSGHTIHGYARVLKAFFSWAEREGIIESSPMRGVRMPKRPQLVMPSFSEDEVKALLDPANYEGAMRVRNHTMLVVLLDTGIRVSELVGLKLGDLVLEEGHFVVRGKGNKQRPVPMGRRCQSLLYHYVHHARPVPRTPTIRNVFLSHRGSPITTDWVYKIVADMCRKLGIRARRLGPHTCRHTFAKRFLMNGGDLLTLQRILGHTSLEVVKGYVNLNTQDLLLQQRRFSPVDCLGVAS